MNLGQLVQKVKFLVNNSDGVADQDFDGPTGDEDRHYKFVVNEAYKAVVATLADEVGRGWLRRSEDVSWATGEVTRVLPASLQGKRIEYVMDVSNGDEYGTQVAFSEVGEPPAVYFKSATTLQWGDTGPGQDTTLRFFYIASPAELVADADVPELIPEDFHSVLMWRGAMLLREIADEAAPAPWQRNYKDWEMRLIKALSMGRPMIGNPGRIRSTDWPGP